MDRLPTEEEWKSWRTDPVTLGFLRWVTSKRNNLKEEWVSGKFSHENNDASWAANHAAIGFANALREILELDFPAFSGEFEEPERLPASGPRGPDQELPSGEDLDNHRDA